MIKELVIETSGQGLREITDSITEIVKSGNIASGLCALFIQHTSASLLIQENADPSAIRDLENWLKKIVPENNSLYTHTAEGPDDMPAHIKSMLTQTSLSIPVCNSRLMLGTWQGIYVFEHRHAAHSRRIVVQVLKDE